MGCWRRSGKSDRDIGAVEELACTCKGRRRLACRKTALWMSLRCQCPKVELSSTTASYISVGSHDHTRIDLCIPLDGDEHSSMSSGLYTLHSLLAFDQVLWEFAPLPTFSLTLETVAQHPHCLTERTERMANSIPSGALSFPTCMQLFSSHGREGYSRRTPHLRTLS